MRHSNLVVVMACALSTACGAREMSLRETRVAQLAVESQLEGWVRNMNNRVVDSVAMYYHQVDSLKVIWPTGLVTRGWEQELQAQADLFARAEKVNLGKQGQSIEILNPELALTTFRATIDVVDEQEMRMPPSSGFVTLLWMKDPVDDIWKIHLQHFSVNPPATN